ncbi:hypothetical protein Poly51_50430 [Rubripirellula tenax]|uniref:Uncharacterized protein n=1 Tax=Rubripirellula tenax TaxID=2528015 RepID=A0A5C6EFK6_9BACT|nr:hypothetical protein [Rubripirellula tenax]TWU47244.1 hypothetical protein Poly51_50430 [Rubripirellula tenax]
MKRRTVMSGKSPLPRRRDASLSRRRFQRRGAAFFMLVLAVLIVIVAATGAMIRGEWATRHQQRDRASVRTLQSAIDAVRDVAENEMTLPLAEDSNERIIVTKDFPSQKITARWMRGEKELDQLVRPFENTSRGNE